MAENDEKQAGSEAPVKEAKKEASKKASKKVAPKRQGRAGLHRAPPK